MPMNQRVVVIGITLTIAALMMLSVAAAAPGGTIILDLPVASRSGLPGTTITHTLQFTSYLPVTLKMFPDVCRPTGEIYDALPIYDWEPAQRLAQDHADLNLALRGYIPINAFRGLVDIGNAWDPSPPQLAGIFSPPRAPDIQTTYQVYGWDWGCNCRIGPISPPEDPEVTLIGLAATPGETVHVPDRLDGEIAPGYKAMVLYADTARLSLKYTAEDNVIAGYTVHIEDICVDSNLLALYQRLNKADRHELPALHGGQAVGRARINRVGVVVRDTGTFMDPRSRQDWWRGY